MLCEGCLAKRRINLRGSFCSQDVYKTIYKTISVTLDCCLNSIVGNKPPSVITFHIFSPHLDESLDKLLLPLQPKARKKKRCDQG